MNRTIGSAIVAMVGDPHDSVGWADACAQRHRSATLSAVTATPAVILLAALPWGARTAAGIIAGAESQGRFREMRNGMHPDRAMVLRARIEMASPNLQLRDPAIYRIRHAAHHRTGEKWRVYPTYIYAHPIEDALENITHSFARLEFA